MMQVVKIRDVGFVYRLTFDEFIIKYSTILPPLSRLKATPQSIIEFVGLNKTDWQIGVITIRKKKTRIMFCSLSKFKL